MNGQTEVILLAFALLAVVTWAIVAVASPQTFAKGPISPRRRAWGARAWLYAPLWAPALLVLSALAPGVVGLILPGSDHCLSHAGSHHHHLCLQHPPHASESFLSWAIPTGVVLPAVVILCFAVRRVFREKRLANALVATSRRSSFGADIRLLDQRSPFALTVGWLEPTILLSVGLVEGVSPDTLRAVIAHERAHARRRDTWKALADRIVSAILPVRVARRLLGEVSLAREQACDRLAAEEVESPIAVARALTEVARLKMAIPSFGVSIAGHDLRGRIRFLLDSAARPPKRCGLLRPIVTILGLALAGAGPVHLVVEHLITYVVH